MLQLEVEEFGAMKDFTLLHTHWRARSQQHVKWVLGLCVGRLSPAWPQLADLIKQSSRPTSPRAGLELALDAPQV